ncbi:MAG: TorF family putative porin [Rhizomicrobium sp.]|nr:TorF family putative porin [Rhizomicrobium sp.]
MKSFGLKITFAAALLASVAMPALADDAPPAPSYGSIAAYLAVESDYRYRGISQNNTEVTPEGSVNWTGPIGFYAGTWLAKTDWGGKNPGFEMDIYGGKHFDLDGTDLNIEAYYYSYPDFNAFGGPKASYFEMQGYLTHTWGKLTLTAMGAYSPEWSLAGGDGWYTAGTAAYAVTDWLSLSGTLGHQWVKAAPTDYTHWDVGATATYKSFSLDVRYVGNDIKAGDAGFWMATKGAVKDTVKANLTYNFNLL